jgi:sugar-specific transcriptional regulator TrmB
MSLERIIKALIGLGLSRSDAEVYFYTAKKGPQTVMDLHNSLNYSRHQVSNSLKTLIAKKLVNKEGTIFSALPFEEALEMLIEREKEKAKQIPFKNHRTSPIKHFRLFGNAKR